MRYLVISDIHGDAEKLTCALEYFERLSCHYLVILGDLLNHGARNKIPEGYDPSRVVNILNDMKSHIICVRGNCDGEVDTMLFSFPCNAPYSFITASEDGPRIFLTHGHLHPFKTSDDIARLGLKAGDLVLSGHTHVSGIFYLDNGIINMNPGSVALPKGGTEAGFGLVTDRQISIYNLQGRLIKSHDFI